MTDSVDANELSAAGIAYHMRNDEVAFGDDGELVGYREVGAPSKLDVELALELARKWNEYATLSQSEFETLELALATFDCEDATQLLEQESWREGDHRSRYNSASEGLIDTSELSDDNDRWAHFADSHVSEMREAYELSKPRPGDDQPEYGALEFWQRQREERYHRLRRFALRTKRQGRWAQLATLKAGVKARYAASADLVKRRGKDEWWMLYLTRAQVDYLLRV